MTDLPEPAVITETSSLFDQMCEQDAQRQRIDKVYGYIRKTDSDKAWELMNFTL